MADRKIELPLFDQSLPHRSIRFQPKFSSVACVCRTLPYDVYMPHCDDILDSSFQYHNWDTLWFLETVPQQNLLFLPPQLPQFPAQPKVSNPLKNPLPPFDQNPQQVVQQVVHSRNEPSYQKNPTPYPPQF